MGRPRTPHSELTIVSDSREQVPLSFPGVPTRIDTLLFGDYACEIGSGTAPPRRVPVVFERKSLGDLFSTMTSGHERFKSEILLAREHNVRLYLGIEALLKDVRKGYKYSSFKGESCISKLFTLWAKYGVQPVFCDGRRELAAYILETFKALERVWK